MAGCHLLAVRVKAQVVASVQRNEQNLTILVELLLGAVAVMDVPVEYANTLTCLASDSGRNGHVIEKAEACRLLALGMVTWRPDYAIASLEARLLVKHLPQTQHSRLRRQQSRLITPL